MIGDIKVLLKKLIQIESFSGEESQILGFIREYLKNKGIKTISLPRVGLVVHFEGSDKNRAIIFNAHVDTVPAERIKILEKEGKIFGLGASDMKGSLAAMLNLAVNLNKEKPECDVWFAFTIKEETDGSGTKEFVKWFSLKGYTEKYEDVFAIIGEPTGLRKIAIGQKGNMFLKLNVYGDSGHGAEPEKIKKNAILAMAEIIKKIEENKQKVLVKYSHPIMGIPTLAVTAISGGEIDRPNRFFTKCVLALDLRIVPGMNLTIKELINEILPDIDFEIFPEIKIKTENAVIVNEKEKIVQALKKACKINKVGIYRFSSDLPTFVKNGIPACIFGAGNQEVIHKPNECVSIADVEKLSIIYKNVINLV